MSTISGLDQGIRGIERGLEGATRSAAKVASAEQAESSNPADLAQPLVELKLNELQIVASANVVRRIDETLGSLLDVKA